MKTSIQVSIVGGSGALGSGLAYRLAKAGHSVAIGSRSSEKAAEAADALNRRLGGNKVTGMTNVEAAAQGEIVFLTVPFASHGATLEEIKEEVQGKIVVDVTVPLVPPRVARVTLPPNGSAAVTAQLVLGDGVRVVSAFHNVAATHLHDDEHEHECDVMVFGNDKAARDCILALSQEMGLKAWHGGAIDNSVMAESLTSVLIFINKNYGIDGAGIRITGRPNS
ncbi:NADPH-dependent F420 reductase [Aminobacter niigataensis]|uniref:NADPH-dependent F420 reductase n=1 Tax=Aminobacter niigataensis TaxID=83265 RepID=UPI0024C5D4EB|nr:NADPH-dependent F420 reductase [Aminobacter niigataensis]CAI2931848.1 NADPH-dependent F420 reductase [Aminobacter niigataensis]